MKTPNIKFEQTGSHGASGSSADGAIGGVDDDEFQQKKQDWQDELDGMSEFLYIKSTEEQKEEGVENPVDTAYVVEKDGMPVLRAVFDVHHFKRMILILQLMRSS